MVMQYALVTTTFGSPAEAEKLIRGVLESRLAACAQRTPIQSDYWWLGKLENAHEVEVKFKTRAALVEALKAYILNNHSYKTPQITVVEIVGGNSAYLRWIDDETAGGRL
ncbi:MAG: divalent-cation tolerance protein CutA [Alphaproteobacteria bacterium]|nr:divalent-cation tolerance protein CutA [Alphaproteobacteria bacterium]